MGLDNGIYLTRKDSRRIPFKEMSYQLFDDVEEEKGHLCYEVCYWRNKWQIRDAILGALHYPRNGDCGIYYLGVEECRRILDAFEMDRTDVGRPQLWQYITISANFKDFLEIFMNDYLPLRRQWKDDVRQLKKLVKFLEQNRDMRAIFIDSY